MAKSNGNGNGNGSGSSGPQLSVRGEFIHYPATNWSDPRFVSRAGSAVFADPHISLTSRGCIIRADSMIDLANEVLKAAHLENKKQLGLLTEPVLNPGYVPKYFDYTRADHVSIAAVIMDLEGKSIGANLDERSSLRLGTNLHDHFTSPDGDSLKLIDRAKFDEDRDPTQFKSMAGWQKLRDRYHFNEKLFWDTLLGTGWPRELNDLADKASYLALDAAGYILHCRELPPELRPAGYYQVKELLDRYPAVCDIHRIVRRAGRSIVLTDAELFGAFLRLRGLMFALLYYNPLARVEEHFVGSLVLPYFYRRGLITHEELFPMSDTELAKRIGELIGIVNWRTVLWRKFQPQAYAFRSRGGAEEERNALLEHDPDRTILLEKWGGASSSGTLYLVQKGNRILPFRQAYPVKAAEVEGLMEVKEPFRLYSFRINFAKYPRLQPVVAEYNRLLAEENAEEPYRVRIPGEEALA